MATKLRKNQDYRSLLEHRITNAISNIILDSVFFGSLLLRLKVEENPFVTKSMATDGRCIVFSPSFVEKLTDSELKGVIVHEVLHCALAHHARRQERETKRWNAACDYAINPVVKQSGFVLPASALIDLQYADMSAEEIYDKLPPEQQGGSWEIGDVLDMPDDNDDAKIEQQQWKQYIAEAANAAKMMGKMPTHLARMVDEYLAAKLPWKELLARFVHSVAKNDFNWSRPNRAFLTNYNLYIPTLHDETCGAIALAIDTSGSINIAQLTEFMAELNGILELVRPEKVHVIYCDAAVNHTEEFTPDQYPVKAAFVGGGGTDFQPVFTYIEKNDVQPQCLIYLTDMYGTFPSDEPDYPVMWVSNSRIKKAPFGQVVELT